MINKIEEQEKEQVFNRKKITKEQLDYIKSFGLDVVFDKYKKRYNVYREGTHVLQFNEELDFDLEIKDQLNFI